MSKIKKTSVMAAALAASFGFYGTSAIAATYTFDSDYGPGGWVKSVVFNKSYGFIVREGNAARNGDWERGIVGSSPGTLAQGDTVWGSDSTTHTFSFSIEENGEATHSVGSQHLTYDANSWPGNANSIAIRAKANQTSDDDTSAPKADLSNISLVTYNADGSKNTITSGYSLFGDSNAQYVLFTDLDLTNGFTLTGDALFDIGSSADGSHTQYEIKIGETTSVVPIPAAAWLFGSALAGLAGVGAARQRRNTTA